MDTLKNQTCPICGLKTLVLTEDTQEIPFFGRCYLFSMRCSNCKYFMSDVESEEQKPPARCTFTVENEKDLKVRIVKSSTATVKIPQLKMSVTPGPASIGYVSNIEGILDRFKEIIESERDCSEEDNVKQHAKSLLKKLWKIKLGDISLKIIIDDPAGNSAIISEKAKIEPLKPEKEKQE